MVENLLTIFHASISNKKMYLQKCAPKEVCTFLQSVHLKNCKKVRVLRMLRRTMSSPDDVHGEASNKSFWGQHKLFQNIV